MTKLFKKKDYVNLLGTECSEIYLQKYLGKGCVMCQIQMIDQHQNNVNSEDDIHQDDHA